MGNIFKKKNIWRKSEENLKNEINHRQFNLYHRQLSIKKIWRISEEIPKNFKFITDNLNSITDNWAREVLKKLRKSSKEKSKSQTIYFVLQVVEYKNIWKNCFKFITNLLRPFYTKIVKTSFQLFNLLKSTFQSQKII